MPNAVCLQICQNRQKNLEKGNLILQIIRLVAHLNELTKYSG